MKMRFMAKRIKRQNPHSCVVRIRGITIYSNAETDGGGAGRSVGYGFVPPAMLMAGRLTL